MLGFYRRVCDAWGLQTPTRCAFATSMPPPRAPGGPIPVYTGLEALLGRRPGPSGEEGDRGIDNPLLNRAISMGYVRSTANEVSLWYQPGAFSGVRMSHNSSCGTYVSVDETITACIGCVYGVYRRFGAVLGDFRGVLRASGHQNRLNYRERYIGTQNRCWSVSRCSAWCSNELEHSCSTTVLQLLQDADK